MKGEGNGRIEIESWTGFSAELARKGDPETDQKEAWLRCRYFDQRGAYDVVERPSHASY